MAPLLVGDDIISADDPARILVVDRPEGVRWVYEALREYRDLLEVDACHDLQSALDRARAQGYDVVLLALQLPDSWPAETYERFRREIEDVPVLVIASGADASRATQRASSPPFCVIEKESADPARIRRLVVSASLFKRAGGKPQSGSTLAAAST